MGVNCSILDFLLRFRETGLIRGDCLQLGRQGLHIPADHHQACKKVFGLYDKEENFELIFSNTGYTENLFKYLGCDTIISMDNSPYEGAEIIHDLNDIVPEEYHNKYDVIFDGGTLEHIFDVKTTFFNVKKMLKVGGIFISVNGANNHLGHGFYQFGPDLYHSLFSEKTGYKMIAMHVVAATLDPQPRDITVIGGNFLNIKTGPEEQYINVLVQKLQDIDIVNPQQKTYLSGYWKK